MKEEVNKKQIVVFGGCFNPPLNSHFSLAEQMVNEYNQIEKILFVPVNSKYQKVDLISNEHRYQMLQLVCDKNEKFEVSRIEIDSQRALYTIETLTELQKTNTEYEICFTMGSDNLKELETWHKAEEIVRDFKIYVFERDRDNIAEMIHASQFLKSNQQAFIKVENKIKTNLSSTFARERIREGKSIKYLAPDEIVSYIKENNLYKEEGEI